MKLSVKKGDNVLVITGKDAGKQGKVLATNPSKNRIVVEGVNMISRHTKARSAKEAGGIFKREGTIDVSNVMIMCPACGKPTRIKHTEIDGKNTRVCKCGAVLDKKFEKVAKSKAKKEKKIEKAEEKAEKKTKLVKEKSAKTTSTKNRAESTVLKRKQEMQ